MTDAFRDGGIALHELRADRWRGGHGPPDATPGPVTHVSRCAQYVVGSHRRGAATIAGPGAGLVGSHSDELNELLDPRPRFEPEDPLFVDLGYAAWRRALEHA